MKVFVLVTLLSAAQAGAPPGSPTQPKPQQPPPPAGTATNGTATPPANLPAGVAAPADFVIGPNDVLTIVFWRDKDMSSDVQVRPDGKISLPLLNDVQAAGLTPEQLRVQITAAATRLVEDPTVSVVVKEINSRRVFITGQVAKPGTYALSGPTTVLQLIAMAGGFAGNCGTCAVPTCDADRTAMTRKPFITGTP